MFVKSTGLNLSGSTLNAGNERFQERPCGSICAVAKRRFRKSGGKEPVRSWVDTFDGHIEGGEVLNLKMLLLSISQGNIQDTLNFVVLF